MGGAGFSCRPPGRIALNIVHAFHQMQLQQQQLLQAVPPADGAGASPPSAGGGAPPNGAGNAIGAERGHIFENTAV